MSSARVHSSSYARGADFSELWDAILEQPQNDERHQRFIRFAVLSQRHLEAAERYGELAAQGELYADIADKYRKALALQVAAQTMSRRVLPRVDRRRARLGWVLVGTGITFTGLFLITQSYVGYVGPVALLFGILEVRASRSSSS